MPYTKQTWRDSPATDTPINAARLGHIEDGIFDTDAAVTAETSARTAADANLIPLSQKGVAGGVATLDIVTGKLTSSQIGTLTTGTTYPVSSQAAMLALPAHHGDIALRTDFTPNQFYWLVSDSPSTLADWVQFTPPGGVVSVNGLNGAVSGIVEYARGTDPTGVAESSTAINAATAALPDPSTDGPWDVRGGGRVRLPAGILRLAASIAGKSNVMLDGDGDGTIILVDGNFSGYKAVATDGTGLVAWGLHGMRFMVTLNRTTAATGTRTSGSTAIVAPDGHFTTGDQGQAISGAGIPSRTITDAVTSASKTTVTSAAGSFTSADVGSAVSGTGIQKGTVITSLNSATSIEISREAMADGSGVSLTINTTIATVTDSTRATLSRPATSSSSSASFTIAHDNATAIETVAFGEATGGHSACSIRDVRVMPTSGAIPVWGQFRYGFIGDFFLENLVDNLQVTGCWDRPVWLKNNSNANAFTNAVIRANVGTGLRIEDVSSPMFMSGTIEGNGFVIHRTVTDGVTTNGSRTVTSATGAFTTVDEGGPISGAGIPTGTIILKRNSATSATISQRATATGSAVTLDIGRPINVGVDVDTSAPNFLFVHFEQTGSVPDVRINGGASGTIVGGESTNVLVGLTNPAHYWTIDGLNNRGNLAWGAGVIAGRVSGGSTAYLSRQGAPIALVSTTVNGVLVTDLPIRENSQAASYTLRSDDAGAVVTITSASAATLTILADMDLAVGSTIELLQAGAGAITITPSSGVTLRSRGNKLTTAGQWAAAALRYRGANDWHVTGDLVT